MSSEVDKRTFNRVFFVIFNALGADILFFMTIYTMFISITKGMSAYQISLIETISLLSVVVLFFPVQIIINKIPRQACVITKSALLVISTLLYTFSTHLVGFIIASALYEIAFIFGKVNYIIFQHNLDAEGEADQYPKYRNAIHILYAIVTFVIVACTGYLFNIDQYLPMFLALLVCLVELILSFFYREIPYDNAPAKQTATTTNWRILLTRFMLCMMLLFLCTNSISSIGNTYSKLSIQYLLEEAGLTTASVSVILSYIILGTRIIRVLGDLILPKLYARSRHKRKFVYLYPALLTFGCTLLILGILLHTSYVLKIALSGIGYSVIIASRDTNLTILENLIFLNTPKDQNTLVYQSLFESVCKSILNVFVTVTLGVLPFYSLFVLLGILSVIGFFAYHAVQRYEFE